MCLFVPKSSVWVRDCVYADPTSTPHRALFSSRFRPCLSLLSLQRRPVTASFLQTIPDWNLLPSHWIFSNRSACFARLAEYFSHWAFLSHWDLVSHWEFISHWDLASHWDSASYWEFASHWDLASHWELASQWETRTVASSHWEFLCWRALPLRLFHRLLCLLFFFQGLPHLHVVLPVVDLNEFAPKWYPRIIRKI